MMRKKIFFGILLVMVVLLIGIALFKMPSKIKVSAYTYPYNVVSSTTTQDSIDIKLFVNQKNCYFTNKNKITSAYIGGKEGKIKLSIEDILITNSKVEIKDEKYYLAHYYFKIDTSFESNYEIEINKAYLYLVFSNSTSCNVNIGSFSYYKYSDTSDEIAISSLKSITSKNNQDGFYGFVIGIRNLTNEDVLLSSLELLDTNVKNINIIKLTSLKDSYKYEDYFENVTFIDNAYLLKNDITYLAVEVNFENNDLMFDVETAGLKINANGLDYYMENFVFYKLNIINFNDYNFTIYEYNN